MRLINFLIEMLIGIKVYFQLRDRPLGRERKRALRKLMTFSLAPNDALKIKMLKENLWMLSTVAERTLEDGITASSRPSKLGREDNLFLLRRSRTASPEQAVRELGALKKCVFLGGQVLAYYTRVDSPLAIEADRWLSRAVELHEGKERSEIKSCLDDFREALASGNIPEPPRFTKLLLDRCP
jgi:hypothetical protein